MSGKFGIIPVHPGTLTSETELEAIVSPLVGALERLGGERWKRKAVTDRSSQLCILVATGGSEKAILELHAERRRQFPDQPLFLIAHPGNNSLPAALEVLARLQQDGTQGRIFYLQGTDDERGLGEITEAVQDLEVRRALRRARIGLVGAPSDWLVASMPDPEVVTATWGPTVVPIDMDQIAERFRATSEDEAEPHATRLAEDARETREPAPADIRDAARLYLALKRVVTEHQLDALTVRCFDFVQQQRTTGCFALAQLTDEGVVAGCEGDLVSTTGLLWAQTLLGVTPWMANPAQLDPAGDTLWLAHCTVPRTMVECYTLRSHFESGLGVGIQGTFTPGPVTVLRIGGKKMDRIWLAEGRILQAGTAENLCRTQVEVNLTRDGAVTDLLRQPLGNHLVLVPGHHLNRLRSWCANAAGGVLAVA